MIFLKRDGFVLKRILTALFGLPLVFFLIHKGGLILQVAVFICAMIGLNEIYSAMSKNKLRINILGYLLSGAYIFILNNFTFKKFIIISSTFIIITLIFLVFDYKKINIIDCMIMLFGFFYVSFLLSFKPSIGSRKTHAPTTRGPAQGPLPTSSIPNSFFKP